ncbi:transcription factor bHLH110-like isoform X2 [Solanum dulcamara]|uniref:transcription factor bHLH110-like isoform X2 n=1 Tax=Solanum dulcamara TaxID=45834 RepID=UPI0024851AAB|nr:transcription factor bHLH110-like isoform X2 [Solanum dulcamara]
MDSTNLYNHHQLQQQQQLAGYPFCTGVSTVQDWNSGITSEEEYYYKLGHMKMIQNNISSEELWKRSIDTYPLMNTSMFHDDHHESSNDQLDDKNNKGYIISSDYFYKMKDMSNNLFKESYFENEQQHAFDLNENLLSEDSYMNNANKTSIAFSGLTCNSSYISSHEMEHSDFQGLKLAFNGLTFKNNISGHFATERMSSGFAHGLMQELTHSSSSNRSNKIKSNVRNDIGVSSKAKRFNYSAEEAAIPCQEASKKPRVTSQSSSTLMLKVRKEKLGDRISALHRLVAPFGKTDTASVLKEAIGYIQFLQDQILTLSMPYTKSAQGKLQHIHLKDSRIDMKSQPVLDLESRGLCLVPTSFSSYITFALRVPAGLDSC